MNYKEQNEREGKGDIESDTERKKEAAQVDYWPTLRIFTIMIRETTTSPLEYRLTVNPLFSLRHLPSAYLLTYQTTRKKKISSSFAYKSFVWTPPFPCRGGIFPGPTTTARRSVIVNRAWIDKKHFLFFSFFFLRRTDF